MPSHSKLALVILALVGCTDDGATVNAAKAIGLRDVQAGGYSFFGCGQDDFSRTKFTATNINDERVNGIVCCGILKGCTVRFE